MKILLTVTLPHGPFNAAVRDGSIGPKLKRILDETKPEAAYFTEVKGHRGAVMVLNLPDPSKIPSFCEPWLLTFEADIELRPVMTPDELQGAGLEELGNKWSR